MNRRQTVLLIIIIAAILLYCWILFIELPEKTAAGNISAYIDLLNG